MAVVAALATGACDHPSFQAIAGDKLPQAGPAAEGLRLSSPRAAHSAVTLPNGDILFIGGCTEDGCEVGPGSRTMDRFDWRSGTIGPAGRLDSARVTVAAAALGDGRIMIAGGWAGSEVTASVALFDPRAGQVSPGGQLSEARADIAQATLPDGRILLIGGFRGGRALDVIEQVDPATGAVTVAGRLTVPRAGAALALMADGRVLIVGGAENGTTDIRPSAAAEIFDPATAKVTRVGSLRFARYKHAAVTLSDGRVLVVGGSDERDRGGKLTAIEAFDPAASRFDPAGETLAARYKIGSAVLVLPDSRVLIAGGAARPEIYDPATGRSQHAGPLLGEALNFSTASLLPDGSVIIAGGYSENGIKVRDRVWRFRPSRAGPHPGSAG